MAVACYKCGAFPNHPSKTLDVLKLIQCSDCGTIACIKHRKGIIGGQCKCGSSRSFIVAVKSKDNSKPQGSAGVAAGGGGGGSIAVTADSVSISQAQLAEMKQTRQDAEVAVQQRQEAISQRKARKAMTAAERERAAKAEAAVQALLGDKKIVMTDSAEDMIKNIEKNLPEGTSLADIQKTINGEKIHLKKVR